MNKICAAIVALTLVSGLSISTFAEKQRKRSAVFIRGGAKTGAVVNRNRSRPAQPRVISRVRGGNLLGTTYGGDGPEKLRKGVKR